MEKYSFLLFGMLFLLSCENSTKAKKEMSPEQVINWLGKIPATDNPFDSRMGDMKSSTWKEWAEIGRKIPGVEDQLLTFLSDNKNTLNKSEIIFALGEVGTEKCSQTLIDLLETKNLMLKMEAISSLGRLKICRSIPLLCEEIMDPDENIRANACTALGYFHSEQAESCIRKALNDENFFVQKAAKEALNM